MEPRTRYRLIRPGEAGALRGLRVLIAGPETAPGMPARGNAPDTQAKLDGFLAYARHANIGINHQVLALEAPVGNSVGSIAEIPVSNDDEMLSDHAIVGGMCLWVPSPGRTAMLFAPSLSDFPQSAAATELAVAGALEDARSAGVMLAQAMLEPADAAGKTVFAAAGLTQLATLTYMERRPPMHPIAYTLPAEFTLEPYSAETHNAFRTAILRSYEQTLDCPALAGLRDVDDIILGHKAVGPFDPQLWSVLIHHPTREHPGDPVGCVLLAEISARRALELVYLGLAPSVRGRGLGRVLMNRVLSIASRRAFELATLAVDAANIPAARLYRRCGYTSVAQRVAMIKKIL